MKVNCLAQRYVNASFESTKQNVITIPASIDYKWCEALKLPKAQTNISITLSDFLRFKIVSKKFVLASFL
jgi:hypothetical protein